MCARSQKVVKTLCPLQDLDLEDGDAVEGDALPKASTKKKPLKVEENRSKKEHVNVVFIGHVGEWLKRKIGSKNCCAL